MVDVSHMIPAKIEEVVREVVKGAKDPISAMAELRKRFPTSGIVWVKAMRDFRWQVQLQPLPGSNVYEFMCDRRP
ncbi:MAG: hypothetical protein NUV60_01805 [Patescibacteria group bacterium]|nr:hypothetical protein [Patescibacteria group bacterium]